MAKEVQVEVIKEGEFVDWDEILSNDEINFILTSEQMKKLLNKIGKDVDDEGFLIENDERILSLDSDEVKISEVGALLPGSKIFIKQNIASFSQYLAEGH